MRHLVSLAVALLAALPLRAPAAEGMWPLNMLPEAALKAHGLQPDVARLQAVAVNFNGASGSFVSPQGLVLTNHHVVTECLDRLSSPQRPLLVRGFVAAKPQDELRCPGMAVKVLQGIDDVGANLPPEGPARQAAVTRLTGTDCPAGQVCELVPLYGGALLHRYRYRLWDDVRLVMAPEAQAANFGGDDDNFGYPRFGFDFALVRLYDADGRPHRPAHWLRAAQRPLRLGDAIMVPGHPYRTERLKPVVQTEAERDLHTPLAVAQARHELQALRDYARTGPEAERQTMDAVLSLENHLKVIQGEWAALQAPALLQRLRADEAVLRQAAPADSVWAAAQASEAAAARLGPQRAALAPPSGSLLDLTLTALTLREERRRPAAERLAGLTGPAEDDVVRTLAAPRPVYPALERARLAAYLRWMQSRLGAEHPWVQAALAGQPDADAAARLHLQGSTLGAALACTTLLSLDDAALARHPDPLVQLARTLLPHWHGLQVAWDAEVRQPRLVQMQSLARLRWQAQGATVAPDATASLRLSFGHVAEQDLGGLRQPWFSTLGGLWARADGFDGQPPFDLAPRLAALRPQLDPRTPLNFISTADIVGGNSGSPILNAEGDWVGVVFDGNLDTLASSYAFDTVRGRAVSVHLAAIRLALTAVYPARHLDREMGLRQSTP